MLKGISLINFDYFLIKYKLLFLQKPQNLKLLRLCRMLDECHLGEDVMVELGLNCVESISPDACERSRDEFVNLFKDYLQNRIDYDQACAIMNDMIGKSDPITKIRTIIELPPTPLPDVDTEFQDSEAGSNKSSRKKTRTWSVLEDNRLLAGVYHYGTENWKAVSSFLGSGRNRAQCSQRWTRCLNPHISKKNWTDEENQQLEKLVEEYGDKAWTKISAIMGNRSDVQCRYHYKQLRNEHIPLDKSITQSSISFHIRSNPDQVYSPSPAPGKSILDPNFDDREVQISLSEMKSRPAFVAQSTPNLFRMRSIMDLIQRPLIPVQCGIVGGGPSEIEGFLRNFQ